MWQRNAIKKKCKIKTKYCLFALFFHILTKFCKIIDLDMLNFCFHLMLNLSWEVILGFSMAIYHNILP
jgi:hypothetical protein